MKFSLLKDLKDLSNKDCSLPSRLISYSFPSLTPSITCHQLTHWCLTAIAQAALCLSNSPAVTKLVDDGSGFEPALTLLGI